MGFWSSLKRYFFTLGGLIGSDIDSRTDKMLTTPAGVKATYQETREKWTKQYGEVREAVAKLMSVLEQKNRALQTLDEETKAVDTKMKGAVAQFKDSKDPKYQEAFTQLFNRSKELQAERQGLEKEVAEMQGKVEQYKARLKEMQERITSLQKQEAEAIADIVSAQQIISLNDRLSHLSTALDDRNLQAVEEKRSELVAQAKLSDELTPSADNAGLDKELLQAGMQSEAAEVFAAMLAEDEQKGKQAAPAEKQREL